MRILVTGASGFSGAFIAKALGRAGHEVVGVHRRDTPFLAALVTERGVTLVRADLADAAKLPGPFDAVVHTAATSPAPGIDVADMVHDNLGGTAALIRAALDWASRAFIFFSSLSLYGEIAGPVLDERSPIVNPDGYGATKLLGELMLAERAGQLPGLAFRLPGVVGPGAHRNWLSAVAAKLRAGTTVRAFHLDAPFNNAVHINDVAVLIETVLQRHWTGFDAVVLAAGSAIPVRAAIERLGRAIGIDSSIEEVAPAKPSFRLSSERAIVRWGYAPMEIGALIDRYGAEVGSGAS